MSGSASAVTIDSVNWPVPTGARNPTDSAGSWSALRTSVALAVPTWMPAASPSIKRMLGRRAGLSHMLRPHGMGVESHPGCTSGMGRALIDRLAAAQMSRPGISPSELIDTLREMKSSHEPLQHLLVRMLDHASRRPLQRSGGAGAKVPPFKPVFPAFAARSSRVQYNGRKRRSCSPVIL